MHEPKSMRNVHAAKKATFPSGSWMVRNRHPLGHPLKARDAGHASQPGSSDIPANTKSSPISKQEDNHIKRIGCVWLCAQSVASARRRRLTGSRRPSNSPRRRWAVPRSSSAERSLRTAHPLRLCFWRMSP